MVANTVLIGVAYQSGWLPMRAESIEAAIGLNGVAVDRNVAAFRLGRRLALDPDRSDRPPRRRRASARCRSAHPPAAAAIARRLMGSRSLPASVAAIAEQRVRRARRLPGRGARRPLPRSRRRCRRRRAAVAAGQTELGVAVARGYFKVLAYKDEYEVARLHLKVDLAAQPAAEPARRCARRSTSTRRRCARSAASDKVEVGPWILPVFRGLRSMRKLHGTRLDPFGYAASRRLERSLVAEYAEAIEWIARDLAGYRYDAR